MNKSAHQGRREGPEGGHRTEVRSREAYSLPPPRWPQSDALEVPFGTPTSMYSAWLCVLSVASAVVPSSGLRISVTASPPPAPALEVPVDPAEEADLSVRVANTLMAALETSECLERMLCHMGVGELFLESYKGRLALRLVGLGGYLPRGSQRLFDAVQSVVHRDTDLSCDAFVCGRKDEF